MRSFSDVPDDKSSMEMLFVGSIQPPKTELRGLRVLLLLAFRAASAQLPSLQLPIQRDRCPVLSLVELVADASYLKCR